MEKNIKARVQHKHDIESNWLKATNFIPLVSEIIVYDPDESYDYPRIKIGDGKTNINSLPFITKDYAKIADIPTNVSQLVNDSNYLTEHQDISGKLDADKLPEAVNEALAQAKTSGEFDGVSVTHSWNGTVLTITSASGTSSVDLRGEQGPVGDKPKRGVDYWTLEDKAEIKSYVDSAILGGEW